MHGYPIRRLATNAWIVAADVREYRRLWIEVAARKAYLAILTTREFAKISHLLLDEEHNQDLDRELQYLSMPQIVERRQRNPQSPSC